MEKKDESESDSARKERIVYVCAQRIRSRCVSSAFNAWACAVDESKDQRQRMRALCIRISQRELWGCFETWCALKCQTDP